MAHHPHITVSLTGLSTLFKEHGIGARVPRPDRRPATIDHGGILTVVLDPDDLDIFGFLSWDVLPVLNLMLSFGWNLFIDGKAFVNPPAPLPEKAWADLELGKDYLSGLLHLVRACEKTRENDGGASWVDKALRDKRLAAVEVRCDEDEDHEYRNCENRKGKTVAVEFRFYWKSGRKADKMMEDVMDLLHMDKDGYPYYTRSFSPSGL